ncbi:methyltransferase domain-containing protein [Ornithinibacillus sp. L9]|uniref:Methyltransferase domain-containing protein n=1 Tax=Ornithinibacillus caprae TaxID=2678566 RepID=A0A6N8FFP1_9BACI|nr:class I SAM-dependent methyltransferase [Ornithinibacillus caprae]MUK87064.1 methyltransferase domain-containing protein [Ornithinibacillus caprae]
MSYQKMAALYDQLMEDAPYDSWQVFTEKVFDNFGVNVSTIVDLGCGTGEITTRLAKRGYQMIGVDFSVDMLTIAEQKASKQNLAVQWLHQDLREIEGLEQFDAAISYCDVINYITEENDLEKVFQNVFQSLKDGGIFIFDIHSLHHIEQHLINHTFADVTDESSYIWYCSEGDHPGEMYHDLTFFALDHDNKYSRFDETHHQRSYPIPVYEELLEKSGFININFYGDFTLENKDLHEATERIFITAEKRSR